MRLIHSSVQIFSGTLLSFSAYAWHLPIIDFESRMHRDNWRSNQAVKRAYPEIDIYAHTKTIAQSPVSDGASGLKPYLTGALTRGTRIVPGIPL